MPGVLVRSSFFAISSPPLVEAAGLPLAVAPDLGNLAGVRPRGVAAPPGHYLTRRGYIEPWSDASSRALPSTINDPGVQVGPASDQRRPVVLDGDSAGARQCVDPIP